MEDELNKIENKRDKVHQDIETIFIKIKELRQDKKEAIEFFAVEKVFADYGYKSLNDE